VDPALDKAAVVGSLLTDLDLHHPRLGGVLDRVLDQVLEDLPEPRRILCNRR
jgi:hypothetical protein